MTLDRAVARLEELHIAHGRMLPLKPYSTFRIGGFAELGVFPDSREQLVQVLRLLQSESIPMTVIGNGSNILFGDGVLARALIFTERMNRLTVNGTTVTAECGVGLARLASAAAEASLTGMEFAKGIPGTVGGAVVMNAGAYGTSISDVLFKSIAVRKTTGEMAEILLSEHNFGYRSGIYLHDADLICLEGVFELKQGERAVVEARMKTFAEQRKAKQPLEYPGAGSYFKRPKGFFAGKLIEDCGLKGYAVGGAAISEKHAGFVINRGGATAEDVLRLEEYVTKEVFRRTGVMLEREVQTILS